MAWYQGGEGCPWYYPPGHPNEIIHSFPRLSNILQVNEIHVHFPRGGWPCLDRPRPLAFLSFILVISIRDRIPTEFFLDFSFEYFFYCILLFPLIFSYRSLGVVAHVDNAPPALPDLNHQHADLCLQRQLRAGTGIVFSASLCDSLVVITIEI